MIRYNCDLCGKEITCRDDHFLVVMDIRPADDSMALTEEDIDEDHLHQISETLKQLEAQGEEYLDVSRPAKMQFDLCASCRDQFVKSPLAPAVVPKLNFSEN